MANLYSLLSAGRGNSTVRVINEDGKNCWKVTFMSFKDGLPQKAVVIPLPPLGQDHVHCKFIVHFDGVEVNRIMHETASGRKCVFSRKRHTREPGVSFLKSLIRGESTQDLLKKLPKLQVRKKKRRLAKKSRYYDLVPDTMEAFA